MESKNWLIDLINKEGKFLSGPDYPAILVELDKEDIIRKASDILDIKYYAKSIRYPSTYPNTYFIKIKGNKAIDLMEKFREHMLPKHQEKIDLILSNYENKV